MDGKEAMKEMMTSRLGRIYADTRSKSIRTPFNITKVSSFLDFRHDFVVTPQLRRLDDST
jgi:hypothetical protein